MTYYERYDVAKPNKQPSITTPRKRKKKKKVVVKKGYWMKIFLWIIGGAVILCAALGIIYIAALSRIH